MRIVATILYWRDGLAAIEPCIRSIEGVCDEIIVLDGYIVDSAPNIDPKLVISSRLEAEEIKALSPLVEWKTGRKGFYLQQAETRAAMTELARDSGTDWILAIDADEELHDGGKLRTILRHWHSPFYPIAFEHELPDNKRMLVRAGFKCFRANVVPVSQCSFFKLPDGKIVRAFDTDFPPDIDYRLLGPWISHHPERRSGERAQIRLGQVEHLIDPEPDNVSPFRMLSFDVQERLTLTGGGVSSAIVPPYYCPECGFRSDEPGVCTGPADSRHRSRPAVMVAVEPETAEAETSEASDLPVASTAPLETSDTEPPTVEEPVEATGTEDPTPAPPIPAPTPIGGHSTLPIDGSGHEPAPTLSAHPQLLAIKREVQNVQALCTSLANLVETALMTHGRSDG